MSQNNSEETKQKLLFAAKIEFLEKGFQKASLRNICKKAGVTTGALYFFFKDKEDLFSALVSGVYETLTDIFHLHLNAEHEHLEYICRTFEVSKVKTFGAVTELFDFKEREGISDVIEAGQRLFDCIYKDYETSMLLLSKAFLKKTESAEFEKRKKSGKTSCKFCRKVFVKLICS